jgi:branched-chain amino acid transport system substrate-binding protein
MKRQNGIAAILIIVLSILVGGCLGPKESLEPGTVKVGVLFPMTGNLASNGKDCTNGVILAVEDVNADGGISSLGGILLEPVFADTKSNPADGINATRRLIKEDGVVAIIGAYQSSTTTAATQEAEQYEIPFIVSVGIADVITERGFRYTFRILPSASQYGSDEVRFLADLKEMTGDDIKRVALIYEHTDFGTSSSLAQKAAMKKYGMTLATEVSYDASKVRDLKSEISRVLASHPDAILATSYNEDFILIMQAMARAKSKIPIINTAGGGTALSEYARRLGPDAEGTMTVAKYSLYVPGARELNERFHNRFGTNITGDSAYSYQSVMVLADALERAGTTDHIILRDALARTDMHKSSRMILPAEHIRFDNEGQNEDTPLFIAQIQGTDYVPVWPQKYVVSSPRTEVRRGA